LLLELDKDITKVNGEQQGSEQISVTPFLVLFGLRGGRCKIQTAAKNTKTMEKQHIYIKSCIKEHEKNSYVSYNNRFVRPHTGHAYA
jgi:hypothetical protein